MKISVVIPAYNSEKTIKATLDSVVNQTFLPYEIIVVNDGSTDKTLEIVKEYFKNIDYNTKLVTTPNRGVSSARNIGLKLAKGEWVALLDSDDVWALNKLSVQKEIIESNPKIDFLGTSRNNEVIKRIFWKKIGYLTKISPKNLMIRFIFVVPTVIFKKSILNQIGFFDENQKYAEEGIFFIKISHYFNSYFLNESLVTTGGGKAHFGESGLSANIFQMEKGELNNIKNARKINIVNIYEYIFLIVFSLLKFFRRYIIVKLRKL